MRCGQRNATWFLGNRYSAVPSIGFASQVPLVAQGRAARASSASAFDVRGGISGKASAAATIEAVNVSTSATTRLNIDHSTEVGKAGATGRFSGLKLLGDQAPAQGDLVRVRSRTAGGTARGERRRQWRNRSETEPAAQRAWRHTSIHEHPHRSEDPHCARRPGRAAKRLQGSRRGRRRL